MESKTPSSQPHTNTIPNTPIRFVLYVASRARWQFFLVLALVTVGSLLANGLPYLFKLIIDVALANDMHNFVWLITFYPIAIGLSYVLFRASGLVGMRALTTAESFAYNQLFGHLVRHSDAYFSNRFAGTIAAKVSRAANHSESLLEGMVWQYYGSAMQILVVLGLTFIANIWIGFVFLAALVLMLVLNVVLVRHRRKHVKAYAVASSTLSGTTVDTVTNIRAVHQFTRLPFEIGRVGKKVDEVRQLDLKQWALSEYALILNNVIIVALVSLVAWLLTSLWLGGTITAGDVVMVLSLLAGVIGTLTFIGSTMNQFIRHYGEVQEGLEQILLAHDMVDRENALDLAVIRGSISVNAVDFHYSDAKANDTIIKDLNLVIPAYQRVGLVGPSGAGKTTLVALLLRQHEVSTGDIAIDGQNISAVSMDSVRKAIAFVPQDSMLFHRSLKENIAYGNVDASDEEIVDAARRAQAHDFIMETPHGYDTVVGERGIKLSGGQRQRIAIARAILKDAPILILDEATSALDSESEVLIQKALQELMEGKTVIAIAHRLSTLREMDRLIVLDQGRIVQDGTHDELLTQEGIYKRLWSHQAGGFLQES